MGTYISLSTERGRWMLLRAWALKGMNTVIKFYLWQWVGEIRLIIKTG